MTEAFLATAGLILVAELGDKTQLLVVTLAARYRPAPVMLGVLAGSAFIHLLSVAFGAAVGSVLPLAPVRVFAGVLFVGFGVHAFLTRDRSDEDAEDGDDGGGAVPVGARSVALTVFGAFSLAELGDKTQLASLTQAATVSDGLAATVGVWAGATVGMTLASVLAVAVGVLAGRRLPRRALAVVSAAVFVAFGVALLVSGASGL